jgi:hypothetical protein
MTIPANSRHCTGQNHGLISSSKCSWAQSHSVDIEQALTQTDKVPFSPRALHKTMDAYLSAHVGDCLIACKSTTVMAAFKKRSSFTLYRNWWRRSDRIFGMRDNVRDREGEDTWSNTFGFWWSPLKTWRSRISWSKCTQAVLQYCRMLFVLGEVRKAYLATTGVQIKETNLSDG